MRELFNLFFSFAKVGAFTFGGGYAMLPMLQREVVSKHGWASETEIMDYYAVGQCTPGIIAVNVATFIGHKKRGILGGIFATLGVVFPSIVIISIIAACLNHFSGNVYLNHALAGIRLAVCAMVSVTIYNLLKKGVADALTAIIAVATFVAVKLAGLSPVIAVVLSATAGIIFRCFFNSPNRKKGDEK